jgi:hypothetical protein
MMAGTDFAGSTPVDERLKPTAARQSPATDKAPRSRRAVKKRSFYLMCDQRATRAPGYELANRKTLFRDGPPIFVPPLGRRGFRDYPETPLFRFDTRIGRPVQDFHEFCGFWFVSDRTKMVLEGVDPEAFAFLACKVQLRDGTEGPIYWLCDVVRVLDALDEDKSTINIVIADNGKKVYNFPGPRSLIFKEDVVGPHHIFRVMHGESTIACDEIVKLACKTAGLNGIWFRDTSKK